MNNINEPASNYASGLFVCPRFRYRFARSSVATFAHLIESTNDVKPAPTIIIISTATSLTASSFIYRYTHVDTNKCLSDALNFKKQGNYTQQNKWATLYTKNHGKNAGSNFGPIYQTLRNAKRDHQAQRQGHPPSLTSTDAINGTREATLGWTGKLDRQTWFKPDANKDGSTGKVNNKITSEYAFFIRYKIKKWQNQKWRKRLSDGH